MHGESVPEKFGQTKIGYGFNGRVANQQVRNKYINKSIAHKKKKGAASAIRYNLNWNYADAELNLNYFKTQFGPNRH